MLQPSLFYEGLSANYRNAEATEVSDISNGRNPPAETDGTSQSHDSGPSVGPQLGPAQAPASADSNLLGESSSAPQSPYSSARQAIRNLTLPPVADFDIPPSPPGSPPPGPTAKVARFLELKRQGVHFNAKLAQSSALRNPSLLPKLMAFAGLNEEDQYASALPEDIAVPTTYPPWAYADELGKTQVELGKKKEEERKARRGPLDFVSAGVPESGSSSEVGTPILRGRGRGLGGSVAERVMAGLDRRSAGSSAERDGGRRRETERKPSRFRSKSRSPKRRRSRSR